jgi:hypothetical protein
MQTAGGCKTVCSNAAYALKSWMTSIAAWQISEATIKLMVKNTVRGERDVPIEQPGEVEALLFSYMAKVCQLLLCGMDSRRSRSRISTMGTY